MIPLVKDTIDSSDIDRLIEWLKTYPKLTKGEVTLQYEAKWANYIGTKYAVFVNSGSSANLLALAALKFGKFLRNYKVVVPGLAWATDLSPVIHLGMTPILCDANTKNLSVDLELLEEIFIKDNPACLMLVSVLGIPPDMDAIVELCNAYKVILIGDHCESLGSEYKGKKLGNCGEMVSTFSTYFGHHISTIEGGMICTNHHLLYQVLLMMRSHGWSRDLDKDSQNALKFVWKISDFNNLYTFYFPGFNLRSTDLQAYIGLSQLDKLNTIGLSRFTNFKLYTNLVKTNSLDIDYKEGRDFISAFAYPYANPNITQIIERLKENNVDCRPLICGSMGNQPMYKTLYGKEDLKVCDELEKTAIYLPCHDKLKEEEIKFISEILNRQ